MKRFSWFNATALTLGFAFLYLPMVILVIYSFNESKLVTVWAGFSTKWYGELLQNEAFLNAAWVTIKVAVFSSTLATILGTMAAYVLVRANRFTGTHALLRHDLCTAGHARSHHRSLTPSAVHRHRSRPRRTHHRARPHHIRDVLRLCCCLLPPRLF